MSGANRSWMMDGIRIGAGGSDGAYFGLKDEGSNSADAVVAWGDDLGDDLRFIFTGSGGAIDGDEYMRITGATGRVGIGTTTPVEKLDVAGNIAVNGNKIIAWQEFTTPLIVEFPWTGLQTLTPGLTGVPAGARYILADVFVTASINDHQNIILGRTGSTSQKNWVDTPGTQPSTIFSGVNRHAVTLTYNGELDGYTSTYGIWYSSQVIPIS
jgi:hypothetical protein